MFTKWSCFFFIDVAIQLNARNGALIARDILVNLFKAFYTSLDPASVAVENEAWCLEGDRAVWYYNEDPQQEFARYDVQGQELAALELGRTQKVCHNLELSAPLSHAEAVRWELAPGCSLYTELATQIGAFIYMHLTALTGHSNRHVRVINMQFYSKLHVHGEDFYSSMDRGKNQYFTVAPIPLDIHPKARATSIVQPLVYCIAEYITPRRNAGMFLMVTSTSLLPAFHS